MPCHMSALPQKSLCGKEHGAVSSVYRELTGNLSVLGKNTIFLEPFCVCNAANSLRISAISLLSN